MKPVASILALVFIGWTLSWTAGAGPTSAALRETADYILSKFGRGVAGQTAQEVENTTAQVVARYGDDVLPLVKATGHQGFAALEQAAVQAPDVIKLYARKGDEAVWLISEPKKLTIFLKHGDAAADALIKHPGLADDLIEQFGGGAAAALNNVSKQSAQRLGIVAEGGLLAANPRSSELLSVVSRYGDAAMDFIWKNKGALAVTAALGTFLADPQSYISGVKQLIVDPVIAPIVGNTNWTLIIASVLAVVFLPFIARSFVRARAAVRRRGSS